VSAQGPVNPAGRIDFPRAVQGASTGFSVLIIGGLIGGAVQLIAPAVGWVILTATFILAANLAARRLGRATAPVLHGAAAALMAYGLVLPLMLFSPVTRLRDLFLMMVIMIWVGGLTGVLQARSQRRTEPE